MEIRSCNQTPPTLHPHSNPHLEPLLKPTDYPEEKQFLNQGQGSGVGGNTEHLRVPDTNKPPPLSPYNPCGSPSHATSWHRPPCAIPFPSVWAVHSDSLLTSSLQIERVTGYKETAVSVSCTLLTLSSRSQVPCWALL